jgi:predicted metalloprotease
MKAPNSKLQAPEKFQTSNIKNSASVKLELGSWCFSGAWMLVLGALILI